MSRSCRRPVCPGEPPKRFYFNAVLSFGTTHSVAMKKTQTSKQNWKQFQDRSWNFLTPRFLLMQQCSLSPFAYRIDKDKAPTKQSPWLTTERVQRGRSSMIRTSTISVSGQKEILEFFCNVSMILYFWCLPFLFRLFKQSPRNKVSDPVQLSNCHRSTGTIHCSTAKQMLY